MTVIEYSCGSPTAELIGYLYKYKKYLNTIDIYSLKNYAITNLNQRTKFNSEHEIICYIRMYNTIDEKSSSQIVDTLCTLITKNIQNNKSTSHKIFL